MLQFVDLSQGGYAAGKDLQTRKKVRSQAMRDFRRRQRVEREAATQLPTLHLRSEATKITFDSTYQTRERSISGGSSAEVESPRHSTARKTRRKADASYSQRKGSSMGSSAPSPYRKPEDGMTIVADGIGNDHTPSSKRLSLLSTQSQSRLASKSSSITRELSCWSTDSDDIFQSPAQIKQMLAFCTSYVHWLRPGVDSQLAASILAQTWETSHCPMLLAACCLASVGHLDAIQPNRPGGNYAVYKDRVLREVSERMQSPTSATSNETIRALACLLSFEMSRGSGEALTHLQGLKSIINMKGGLEEASLGGISTMLETLDVLHAALFDAEPVLTTVDLSEFPAQSDLSDAEIFVHLTPLLLAEQEEFHRKDTPYSSQLQQLPELLKNAVSLLNGAVADSADPELPIISSTSIEHFNACMERFGQLGSQQRVGIPDAGHLIQACHLNVVMIFNLVRHRIPHRHKANQKYADGLYSAFRAVSDKAWEHLPYLRLWILLTGAVASNDSSKKSYFKAQVVRGIYQMGAGEFRRIKSFMLRYLEVKQVLERPSRRATPPIELVTPITGDASYIYASWPGTAQSKSPLKKTASVEGSLSLVPALSSGGPASVEVSSSQNVALFDDLIDPLLKFGEFEATSDFADLGRQPGVAMSSDRVFEDDFCKDMWLMDGQI